MPFLEVNGIHKRYDNAPLLHDVSFTIEGGEIACLLGPSGGGKTTLLRIIAGLERPEEGSIRLQGQEITPIPAHQRGIVLMFQEYALFPHRTVAENIAFGLKMRAMSSEAIKSRVAEILHTVNLDGFGHRSVNDLSGGECQRVALARSLAPQPHLLLLDEPLGALDRNLRERLLEELPAILKRVGVTALTVTHDQEEAFAIANRIILLHEGSVVQSGTPEIVYNAPKTVWAARFLGLHNLLPAQVSTLDPPQVTTPIGTLSIPDQQPLPAPGTKGKLLIHPWGLQLTPSCAGDESSITTTQARVEKSTFHGSYYQVKLSIEGITLSLSQSVGSNPPRAGEVRTLYISPTALRWVKD